MRAAIVLSEIGREEISRDLGFGLSLKAREICNLRWRWKIDVPQLGTAIFIAPGAQVKIGNTRLDVLNRIALSVIERQQGIKPSHALTYNGEPVACMFNSA